MSRKYVSVSGVIVSYKFLLFGMYHGILNDWARLFGLLLN